MIKKIISGVCCSLVFWTTNVSAGDKVYKEKDVETVDELVCDKVTQEPISGTVVTYYDNGFKLEERHYEKGKKDGVQYIYGINGRTLIRSNFRNGLEHGETKLFYTSGGTLGYVYFEDGEVVSGHCINEYGDRIDFDAAQKKEFKKNGKIPCEYL